MGNPTVSINGNLGFLFIGHDPQVTQHINALFGAGAPTGGAYSWSSPDVSISFDNATSGTVHLTATSYSGGISDTQVALDYQLNNRAATTAHVFVTKRLFKFLIMASNTNVGLDPGYQYGFHNQILYSVYTLPNGQIVEPGFDGIAVDEFVDFLENSFNIQPITNSGLTNSNSQVRDDIAVQSTTPIDPAAIAKASQQISVGGFWVRDNSLTIMPTDVEIQNNGPFN